MSNMAIRTNVQSINAHRNSSIVGTEKARAARRLGSGHRVNTAEDDAAGLAISERLRSQIRGADQASRNAQDGIALIQTTEGALEEINNMLIRMRELTVQAANDTNVLMNRESIQMELNQLFIEIVEMKGRVEFNTMRLLDGRFSPHYEFIPIQSGPHQTSPISYRELWTEWMNGYRAGLAGAPSAANPWTLHLSIIATRLDHLERENGIGRLLPSPMDGNMPGRYWEAIFGQIDWQINDPPTYQPIYGGQNGALRRYMDARDALWGDTYLRFGATEVQYGWGRPDGAATDFTPGTMRPPDGGGTATPGDPFSPLAPGVDPNSAAGRYHAARGYYTAAYNDLRPYWNTYVTARSIVEDDITAYNLANSQALQTNLNTYVNSFIVRGQIDAYNAALTIVSGLRDSYNNVVTGAMAARTGYVNARDDLDAAISDYLYAKQAILDYDYPYDPPQELRDAYNDARYVLFGNRLTNEQFEHPIGTYMGANLSVTAGDNAWSNYVAARNALFGGAFEHPDAYEDILLTTLPLYAITAEPGSVLYNYAAARNALYGGNFLEGVINAALLASVGMEPLPPLANSPFAEYIAARQVLFGAAALTIGRADIGTNRGANTAIMTQYNTSRTNLFGGVAAITNVGGTGYIGLLPHASVTLGTGMLGIYAQARQNLFGNQGFTELGTIDDPAVIAGEIGNAVADDNLGSWRAYTNARNEVFNGSFAPPQGPGIADSTAFRPATPVLNDPEMANSRMHEYITRRNTLFGNVFDPSVINNDIGGQPLTPQLGGPGNNLALTGSPGGLPATSIFAIYRNAKIAYWQAYYGTVALPDAPIQPPDGIEHPFGMPRPTLPTDTSGMGYRQLRDFLDNKIEERNFWREYYEAYVARREAWYAGQRAAELGRLAGDEGQVDANFTINIPSYRDPLTGLVVNRDYTIIKRNPAFRNPELDENYRQTFPYVHFQLGANTEGGELFDLGVLNLNEMLSVLTNDFYGPHHNFTRPNNPSDTSYSSSVPGETHRTQWFNLGFNVASQNVDSTPEAMIGEEITGMVDRIDGALHMVTNSRATLGAIQNRLEFARASLDISAENMSDAESRIRNADMAREMMSFTQASVLQQAGLLMIGQSNQNPQAVLQLLR